MGYLHLFIYIFFIHVRTKKGTGIRISDFCFIRYDIS